MDESRVSNSEDCPTAAASHLRRDRLSELPDSLILEILSLLKMKEVVRTTILSKRWKDLWTDVTCLDFGFSNQTFVEGALAKWKGAKIFKFTIGFTGSPPPSDFVDSCLLIPIEKHVEELVLLELLAPHQRLYSCSSITKLYLCDCDLKIVKNVDVQWNQLKSLTINQDSLSEDAMNRILSGAPLLEELILLSLDITEKLNIQSSSLKALKIARDEYSEDSPGIMLEGMLRIWAPNLLSLDISAFVYGTCLLDVPSLTTAIICFEEVFDFNGNRIDDDFPPLEMFDQFFRSLRHVEKLTLLSALSIEFLRTVKRNYMVVPFSNTKYLKLDTYKAEEMLHVLGMFPEVKMLVAELNKDYLRLFDEFCSIKSKQDLFYTYDKKPHQAMVDACNSLAPKMTFPSPSLLQLKTIEITCYIYDASIIPVVEILLENAHVLEKMVLRLQHGEAHKKTFMLAKKKVLGMPRSSPTARVIIYKKW